MPTPTKEQLWTPEIKQCVKTYLLVLAFAQVKRKAVDQIQRAILQEHTLMATLLMTRRGTAPYRITDPDDVFLCEDKTACAAYFAECNRRARAAHLKPADMPDDHCPALVAEHLLTQAEWCLLQTTAPIWGLDWETVNGLSSAKRAQWIDLHVKLVLACPGFDVSLPTPQPATFNLQPSTP